MSCCPRGRKRRTGALIGGFALAVVTAPTAAQQAADPADDIGEESEVIVAPSTPDRSKPAVPSAAAGPDSGISGGVLAAVPGKADDELSWGMPPIPWRGSLVVNGSRTFPEEGSGATNFSEQFSATGSSYVWQPWFLRVNGNLNAGLSQLRDASSRQDSRTWTTGLGGQFLPGTRTPFNANISHSGSSTESKSASGTTQSDASTLNLGLSQAYSPLDGSFSSTFAYGYMKSDFTSASSAGATQNYATVAENFSGSIGIPIRSENPQSLGINGNLATTRNEQAAARTRTGNLNALHSLYLEDYVMNLSSDANVNINESTTGNTINKAVISQLGTAMDWVPSDDYPLTVNGSARLFDSQTTAGNTRSGVSAATLTGAAIYPLNRNWRFTSQASSAFTQFTQAEGGGIRRQSHTLGAGAAWSGDGLVFQRGAWGHNITYGAGSSVTSSYNRDGSGAAESDTALSSNANAGQVFSRDIEVEGGKPVRVSLSEGYGVSAAATGSAPNHTLNHAVTVNWEATPRPDTRWVLNGSASDGRSFGTTNQVYQQLSGIASADVTTSPYSSLTATGSSAFSRQMGSGSASRWSGSGNAGVRYTHSRFADVSGLIYQAQYNLTVREKLVTRPGGGLTGDGFELEHIASQSWSWRLGLLGWKVDHSVTKFGSRGIGQSIFFSVTRDFSGVL